MMAPREVQYPRGRLWPDLASHDCGGEVEDRVCNEGYQRCDAVTAGLVLE